MRPGDTVVEVGCGTVRAAFAFLAAAPQRYLGVDLRVPMVLFLSLWSARTCSIAVYNDVLCWDQYENLVLAQWIARALGVQFAVERGNSLTYAIPSTDILMIGTHNLIFSVLLHSNPVAYHSQTRGTRMHN